MASNVLLSSSVRMAGSACGQPAYLTGTLLRAIPGRVGSGIAPFSGGFACATGWAAPFRAFVRSFGLTGARRRGIEIGAGNDRRSARSSTFSPGVRKIIYTTNVIESLHSRMRKAVATANISPATMPPARRFIPPSCALSANGKTSSPDGTMLKCSCPSSSANAFASRIEGVKHEISYTFNQHASIYDPQS